MEASAGIADVAKRRIKAYGNVTSTAWISVFPPSSSNTWILLVADKLIVRQELLCFVSSEQSACSHSNMDNADWSWITLWMLANFELVLVDVWHVDEFLKTFDDCGSIRHREKNQKATEDPLASSSD